MKYHDSIKQADQKMNLSVKQLQAWGLASTPINYSVSYEYISGKNIALISAIKHQLSLDKKLDNYYIEQVYQQFVLGQSKFRDEIITDIDDLLSTVQNSGNKSTTFADDFMTAVDANIGNIQSLDKKIVTKALINIGQASRTFKALQKNLSEQIEQCKRNSSNLKLELEDVRKEIYLDPLTGLYNRKAMSKHLETWYTEDPNKQIAAIVINVDQFSHITQHFGSLIGDVLLSKIASKVGSYVGDSGLPVRTGGDEFLILLPDMECNVASEIADKIKQGVEKLRFISSKSGVRLPQMTISIAVNNFKASENVNTIVSKTRKMIDDMKQSISNRMLTANGS